MRLIFISSIKLLCAPSSHKEPFQARFRSFVIPATKQIPCIHVMSVSL